MFFRLREWLHDHRKEISFAVFIFLISFISFAIGFLLRSDTARPPIIIQEQSR